MALAAAATLITAPPRAQQTQPPPTVPADLYEAADAGGRVPVIIVVEQPASADIAVNGPAALELRQAAMRVALDPFSAAAAAEGVAIERRYANFPFFAATVDRAALEWLASRPEVTSVRAPVIAYPQLAQSVPLIQAPSTWNAGFTGAGWYVAVIDSGVAKAHPFLSGKVALEGCASGGALNPDDPDAAQVGVTLCPPTSSGSRINRWWGVGSGVPCTVAGCGHGTHVAGIASGGTGNPDGVSGVAPGARLFAIMAFRSHQGVIKVFEDSLLESFDHVFTEHFLSLNERIAAVNLSIATDRVYGTQAECNAVSPAVTSAIGRLRAMSGFPEAGVATVVASGNSGSLNGVSWPACISSAISVGSTTKNDLISDFTNRRPFLSLLAPGSSIISSMPSGPDAAMNGTSQAAPHVAGAWALLKQAKPDATVTQILQALQDTGVPISDPSETPASTYKRIDVDAARRALTGVGPAAPAPPINVAAVVNGLAATVSWAPGVGGGLPTHYLIVAGTTPGGSQLGLFNVGLTLNANGVLAPGIYYARVIAANAAGQSAPSSEVSFTVGGAVAPPGAPGNLAATVNGNSVSFTWTAPTTGGAVGGYQLIASLTPGGPAIATQPVNGVGVSVPDVPAGTYYVRVVAVNAGGSSGASNVVTVTVGGGLAPGAPTALGHSASAGSVQLRWTAPAAGGTPTAYRIQAGSAPGLSDLADVVTGSTATNYGTAGVPAGIYYVRVRALNGSGVGGPSNEITVISGGAGCSGLLDVIVRWNTSVDVDLHAFEPEGSHVYWGNRIGNSVTLVNDNLTGFGPELLCAPGGITRGVFEIAVVHYSGQVPTAATIFISANSGAQTAVFTRTFDGPAAGLAQRVATIGDNFAITEVTGTMALEPADLAAKPR